MIDPLRTRMSGNQEIFESCIDQLESATEQSCQLRLTLGLWSSTSWSARRRDRMPGEEFGPFTFSSDFFTHRNLRKEAAYKA